MRTALGCVIAIVLCACGRAGSKSEAGDDARPAPRAPAVDATSRPRAPVLTTAELLADGVHERIARRVRLRAFRALRVTADGPPVAEADPGREEDPQWAPSFVVVDETPERVRVLTDDLNGGGALPDHRLLVWIDRSDLYAVVRTPTGLARRAGAAPNPNGPAIGLSPGVALPVLGRDGDWLHVAHDHGDLQFDGWVAFADVDDVYAYDEWAAQPAPNAMVREGAYLLDAPGGAPIARFAPGRPGVEGVFRIPVNTLSSRVEGHEHVSFVLGGIEARGYVRADALSTEDARAGGVGRGMSHGRARVRHTERVELSVRACMYAAADGEPIGVALRAVPADADRDANAPGWWRVAVYPLYWPGFDVWMRDESDGSGPPRWRAC